MPFSQGLCQLVKVGGGGGGGDTWVVVLVNFCEKKFKNTILWPILIYPDARYKVVQNLTSSMDGASFKYIIGNMDGWMDGWRI